MDIFPFLLLGITVGIISGMIGIGGGVLITPALIYMFGFEQKLAQGTTLALLVPPIGILGAWAYYEQGFIDIKVAVLICIGFFIGGFIGARFAVGLDPLLLRRVFGIAMLVVSCRMILSTLKLSSPS